NHFHGAILLDELNNYFTIQGNTIWGATNQGDVFTGVEISNCYAGGLIGGDGPGQGNTIYNSFSDYFGAYFTPFYIQTSIRIIGTPGITIKKNITTCNSYYGSTIELYQPQPGAPFARVDSTGFNFVRGKATPNTRVDIYLDDDCYACEGKQWIGMTLSNADSNWTYNGDFNAAVVATATASDGTTSMFSQPAVNNSGLRIKQPSCGKNNGYIKGMQTNGSDHAKWHLFHQVAGNWADSIVSDSLDLVNAGRGTYYFDAWIGNNCRSAPLSYKLESISVKLDTSTILRNNPSCGKFNGSIKGIVLNTTRDIKIFWKNEQGMFISDKLDLDGQGPGKYKLVVTDTLGGCMDSSFLYELMNQSGPTVGINTAVTTSARCGGSDGSIRGISFSNISGSAFYFWYDEENKLVGTAPDLTNVPAGKYVLKFKDDGACDTITALPIAVPSEGGISFDSSALTILSARCAQSYGSVKGMQVSGADSYSWINTLSGSVAGNGIDLVDVPEGDYKLFAFNRFGCKDSTGIFYVPDLVAPVMDSSGLLITPDVCGLSNGSISGFIVKGNAPIIYNWFSEDGKAIAQSPEADQLSSGQYYLKVKDVNNCVTTSNLLTVPSETSIPDPPDYGNIVIVRNTLAVLQPKNPETGTYFLYDDLQALTADQQNATGEFSTGLLFNDTILYVKLVQGTCESSESAVKIRVVQTTGIMMPDVFSPNHDGRNELFRVPHPELVQQMQLEVFNRWGQKVFETSDPYQGWNGTAGGTEQPAGTYIWMMNCTDLLGKKQQLSGSLVLIR
ncbi:MAG: gliding motility-associated C-terminal domain-containing protein, partial [Bacteroidota bacterium]|nr:gliding motility-associated C-terminal domain-containing protein [Bacteroidota bacterium]